MKDSLKNKITLHSFVLIPVTNTLGFVKSISTNRPWANEAEVLILGRNVFYDVLTTESFLVSQLKPIKIKYKVK